MVNYAMRRIRKKNIFDSFEDTLRNQYGFQRYLLRPSKIGCDCLLQVYHKEILEEIRGASFAAVKADGMADVSDPFQIVIVFILGCVKWSNENTLTLLQWHENFLIVPYAFTCSHMRNLLQLCIHSLTVTLTFFYSEMGIFFQSKRESSCIKTYFRAFRHNPSENGTKLIAQTIERG
ncbi:hypothetical protein CEXT_676781 [Caerostris extrusa]|uniref:Uncharacterized protein n=1 Tax=Caerostris extrusa TaxID=172846 RepID=A0AAV4X3H3_CAEEX|nr:hypothetical protein CEXT_676781 [Caerostris extrusa]